MRDPLVRTAPSAAAVTLMHHHAAQVGHAPQDWVDTEGVGVDKNNGQPGCAGKRPVMKCCPMGKVHSRLMDQALPREEHPQQYGGLPQRSVREPVLILWSVVWRLAHSLKSFLVQLYDVRTAFPQMGWDELFEEVNNSDTTNYAGKRMENTHRRMRVYMTTADGVICLRRKRGVREGATDGPGLFTRGYAKPMREFERELRAADTGQRILLRYNEQTHDLSLGFFIDDVEHLSLIKSPEEARQWSNRCHALLKRALKKFQLAIQPRKSESLVRYCGKGSVKAMETSYGWHPPKYPAPVVGRLLSAVRYLGPYLSVHVDMNVEIRKRIVAANMNFVDFARVLKSSKTPQFGKKVLFSCLITSALLSCMEALAPEEHQVLQLERAHLRLARQCLGRYGYRRTGDEDSKDEEVTNRTVRAALGLPLLKLLLRVRRLKFLRHLVRSGQDRVLASLLGTATWDDADTQMVDATGAPTEHSPPWLRMVHVDATAILPNWTGFRQEWKQTITNCTDETLKDYIVSAQPVIRFPQAEEPEAEPYRCPDCTNTFLSLIHI